MHPGRLVLTPALGNRVATFPRAFAGQAVSGEWCWLVDGVLRPGPLTTAP